MEALDVIKKMRARTSGDAEAGEGMREFIELCQMRFGDKMDVE
jgi:hypothetical protein